MVAVAAVVEVGVAEVVVRLRVCAVNAMGAEEREQCVLRACETRRPKLKTIPKSV